MDTGAEYSTFARQPRSEWHEEFAQAGHKLDALTFASIAVRHSSRGAQDTAMELGISRQTSKKSSVYSSLQYAPQATIYPRWKLSMGGEMQFFNINKTSNLWAVVDAQHNHYPTLTTTILKPGIRYELNENVSLQLQTIHVQDEHENWLFGAQSRLNWATPWQGLSLATGVSNGPETEDNRTIRTQAGFLGAAYPLTENITLRGAYTREIRHNSYIRNVFNTSLSIRF